jgi:hypothetical protein
MNKYLRHLLQQKIWETLYELRVSCRKLDIDNKIVDPYFLRAIERNKKLDFPGVADELEAILAFLDVYRAETKRQDNEIQQTAPP